MPATPENIHPAWCKQRWALDRVSQATARDRRLRRASQHGNKNEQDNAPHYRVSEEDLIRGTAAQAAECVGLTTVLSVARPVRTDCLQQHHAECRTQNGSTDILSASDGMRVGVPNFDKINEVCGSHTKKCAGATWRHCLEMVAQLEDETLSVIANIMTKNTCGDTAQREPVTPGEEM